MKQNLRKKVTKNINNRLKLAKIWLPLIIILFGVIFYVSCVHGQTIKFTLDFETKDLKGWKKTGNAFNYQPTLGDNPTARNRGQPSKHQGKYWIGTYEKYQGQTDQKPGDVQGDRPQGTLTSLPFTIPSGTLSFLVGGGSNFQTRVEILIIEGTGEFQQKMAFHTSGRNTETMHRALWDLSPYAGKTGQIRIVDASSGEWGHINVDDFRFTFISEVLAKSATERTTVIRTPAELTLPPPQIRITLKADKSHIKTGQRTRFEANVSPKYRDAKYQFYFGDGGQSGWTKNPKINHLYNKEGTYRAIVKASIKQRIVQSDPVIILVKKKLLKPVAKIKPLHLEIMQGEKAVFKSKSTYDPEGWIKEYWRGPRGQRGRGHHFEVHTDQLDPGSYDIVLEIMDNHQQRDGTVATLNILPPAAEYKVNIKANPKRIGQGQRVRFEAFFTPESLNVEYIFDFGDGMRSNWVREAKIKHLYLSPGIYQVFVTVRKDAEIITKSNAVEIEVLPETVCRVFIEVNKNNPSTGENVIFKGSIQPSYEKVEYRFDFGDGKKSGWIYEPVTRHTYKSPGTYKTHLIAKIEEKQFFSKDIYINVKENYFGLNLEAEPNRSKIGQTVIFRAKLEPYSERVEYRFVFGDGKMRNWAKIPVAEHVYSEPGNYHVCVIARIGQKVLSESNLVVVKISGFSSTWLFLGPIIAGSIIIFGGGYYLSTRIKRRKKKNKHFKSTVHLRPQTDSGIQHIESDLTQSNFEIRLNPVIDKGKQVAETKNSFIIDERRNHE